MGIRINGSTSGYTELTGPAVGGNSTSGIILPSGTTAERPASGQAGQIRFNTTTGEMEFWSSTSSTPQWRSIKDGPLMAFALQYLVVGGGGAGAGQMSGGGGAGGLLQGTDTGFAYGTYTVTVGAGGAAATTNNGGLDVTGDNGENSVFGSFTALGGGRGGAYSANTEVRRHGTDGGSGGGGSNGNDVAGDNFGLGTSGQGNNGGQSEGSGSGGGGGGAGAAGQAGHYAAQSPNGTKDGDGGIGATTTIITTAIATSRSVGEVDSGNVYFAGGGGAGGGSGRGRGGMGGLGGGGIGGGDTNGANGAAGAANTGGGGGGTRWSDGGNGHAGGSGVVILRVPTATNVSFSSGVTYTSDVIGSDTAYIITATSSTSEAVTFSQ